MPQRSSSNRPKDVNSLAHRIMLESTGQAPKYDPTQDAKNPAAVELGRLGGLKGGKARAESMTPERRKEIAQKAAAARWAKKDA